MNKKLQAKMDELADKFIKRECPKGDPLFRTNLKYSFQEGVMAMYKETAGLREALKRLADRPGGDYFDCSCSDYAEAALEDFGSEMTLNKDNVKNGPELK